MSIELSTPTWRLYSYHSISDPLDDNIDVFVEWDGNLYTCTVFTLSNVSYLMKKWCDSREHGTRYFWASQAIIVPKLDLPTLAAVVGELVHQGSLPSVMLQVSEPNSSSPGEHP